MGVASDDELLVLRLFAAEGIPVEDGADGARAAWQAWTKAALREALPEGVVVHSVATMKSSASFHPKSARYVFDLGGADRRADVAGLNERINELLSRERVVVERTARGAGIRGRGSGARGPGAPGLTPERSRRAGARVDIRPFLKSIEWDGTRATVDCAISNAGSVRVDELMDLLGLGPEDLAGPVRRREVTWTIT